MQFHHSNWGYAIAKTAYKVSNGNIREWNIIEVKD